MPQMHRCLWIHYGSFLCSIPSYLQCTYCALASSARYDARQLICSVTKVTFKRYNLKKVLCKKGLNLLFPYDEGFYMLLDADDRAHPAMSSRLAKLLSSSSISHQNHIKENSSLFFDNCPILKIDLMEVQSL